MRTEVSNGWTLYICDYSLYVYDFDIEKRDELIIMLSNASGLKVSNGFSGRSLYAYFDTEEKALAIALDTECFTYCHTEVRHHESNVTGLVISPDMQQVPYLLTKLAKYGDYKLDTTVSDGYVARFLEPDGLIVECKTWQRARKHLCDELNYREGKYDA